MGVDGGRLPGRWQRVIQQQAELINSGQVKLAFLIGDLGSRARSVKGLPDRVEVNRQDGQVLGGQVMESRFRVGEDQGGIGVGSIPAIHEIEKHRIGVQEVKAEGQEQIFGSGTLKLGVDQSLQGRHLLLGSVLVQQRRPCAGVGKVSDQHAAGRTPSGNGQRALPIEGSR